MGVPMGRLLGLQFREAAFYTDDGRVGSIDVMRIHVRASDGRTYSHDLQNGGWQRSNEALQFLAKWGYRPSDFPEDGAFLGTEADQVLVPITVAADGSYTLAQLAMNGARAALEDAEWFSPSDDEDADSDRSDAPDAPPGPDPGTGNRGGVDHDADDGVTAELAEEDTTAGVTVSVE